MFNATVLTVSVINLNNVLLKLLKNQNIYLRNYHFVFNFIKML